MVRIRISKKWAMLALFLFCVHVGAQEITTGNAGAGSSSSSSSFDPYEGRPITSGPMVIGNPLELKGNAPDYTWTNSITENGAPSCTATNGGVCNVQIGDHNTQNSEVKNNFNGDLGTTLDCSVQDKAASDFRTDELVIALEKNLNQCNSDFKKEPKEIQDKGLGAYQCKSGEKWSQLNSDKLKNDQKIKQLDAQALSCSKKSFAKHDCSDSVTIEYLNSCDKDDKKCRDQKLAELKTDPIQREKYESRYNCRASAKYLDGLAGYSSAMTMVTKTIGLAAASKATQNVAAVAGSGGNALQAGYSELAKANKRAGDTTLALASIDVAVATYAQIKARKHKKDRDIIAKSKNGADLLSEDDDGGQALIDKQVDAHQALVDQANTLAMQSGQNAVMNTLNGLAMRAAAKQNQQQLQEFQVPQTGAQQMGNGYAPPNFNFGDGSQGVAANAYEQNNAATDGGSHDPDAAPNAGGLSFGSAPGSAPTSGGLAGPSPGANNSMVAMSGGGGGPAGGGGGGSGGGGGGSSGDAAETNEDAGSVPGLKYESGAGGGFASNAANKRRLNDTGDLSGIGALLEKFLPKKEEEDNKQGNILSFTQKGGERGLASVEEDGSILGPNSNLFSRVSNSMMANLKKGNLK